MYTHWDCFENYLDLFVRIFKSISSETMDGLSNPFNFDKLLNPTKCTKFGVKSYYRHVTQEKIAPMNSNFDVTV